MIKIPTRIIAQLGIPGGRPEIFRDEIIEYNIRPQSTILIAIGIIGIVLGILSWKKVIPNTDFGGASLQGVGFIYGIACLVMGFLPHLALLLILVFVGVMLITVFLVNFPPEQTFLKIPYSYWFLFGFASVLVFILFIDMKYTMRRQRKKVGKEVDQYIYNLKNGIRNL